eukprot:365702-Chlamydomonas_euryale.AAC.25
MVSARPAQIRRITDGRDVQNRPSCVRAEKRVRKSEMDTLRYIERNEEEKKQLQGGGDTVVDEGLHALEDAARDDHTLHNRRQAGLGQHNVCGRARRVGCALHRHADVGALERGRVVHAVTRHTHGEAALPQRLHNQVLVLRVDLCKAISLHHHRAVRFVKVLGHLAVFAHGRQALGVLDVEPEPEHARRLLGNQHVVARNHLHVHTKFHGAAHRFLRVGARWVEEREHANQLPRAKVVALLARDRDRKRADAALAKRLHERVSRLAHGLVVAQLEDDVGRALGGAERLAVLDDRALGTLDGRVKRHVVDHLHTLHRRHVDGCEHKRVERVPRRLLPLSGHCGVPQQRPLVNAGHERGRVLLDDHLVEGQRAGLVGAQHVHAREVLDCGQACDDGTHRRHLAGAQCQCRGADNLNGDGDGRDEQDDGERDRLPERDAGAEQVAKAREAQHDR